MRESFLKRPGADVFVPDGRAAEDALRSVTHLAVGAHSDDLEFMAFHGIEECRRGAGKFGGVIVTDGAGSVRRSGLAVDDLRAVRREEQREAARLGGYAVAVQLGLTNDELRNSRDGAADADLEEIFRLSSPQVVYTHNPADRHESHVAVCMAVIRALRSLPAERRPARVLGCEVWGDLDWLVGDDRVRLDCGNDEEFARKLNGVFRSQIDGGKRYDLAVIGRRRAQATFDDPRAADQADMVTLAMDLTPLVADPGMQVEDYVLGAIDRFRDGVRQRLRRFA